MNKLKVEEEGRTNYPANHKLASVVNFRCKYLRSQFETGEKFYLRCIYYSTYDDLLFIPMQLQYLFVS